RRRRGAPASCPRRGSAERSAVRRARRSAGRRRGSGARRSCSRRRSRARAGAVRLRLRRIPSTRARASFQSLATGYRTPRLEITRERAWETLTRHTKSEALLRHALAVEASVRAYARKFGENEELWGVTALLHDFDWEMHPTLDQHPQDGAPILRE